MLYRAQRLFLAILLVMIAAPSALHAGGKDDRVQFGKSIVIEENENVGSVVCIACSIRSAGTSGDVVAVGGSIDLEGTAKGDAVAVGGGVRLGENASVSGDVVAVGGGVSRHPNADVKGEITSQSGALILLTLVLVPLVPVILIIALIIWLVGRSRRPVATPARVS